MTAIFHSYLVSRRALAGNDGAYRHDGRWFGNRTYPRWSDPDERTALAIACVTRHVGVAVVVATSFRGPRTAVMLAAY
jgi:hypothetical protein